jgi:xanthine/uracil permease
LRGGVTWAGGRAGNKNFGAPEYLGIAAVVLAVILLLNKFTRGFVANIAVLIGLAVGLGVAMTAGMVNFAGVAESEWFAIVYPFRFGTPTFDASAVVSISIALGMIPLVAPTFFDQLPKWLGPITHSGVTLTAIAAVALNAFFNGPREGETIVSELVDVAKEGSPE